MIDCPNVEMRDRLPDLANDSLEPAVRDLVLVHLTECTACTAEIGILRTTRLILLTTTPRVNVAGIVSALPQYGVASIASATARRGSWASSWRAAAAVTLLAAGIGGYRLPTNDSAPRLQDTLAAAVAPDTTVGLALTGALADLSDAELSALVGDIDKIDALPSTELETTSSGIPAILPDSMIPELEDR